MTSNRLFSIGCAMIIGGMVSLHAEASNWPSAAYTAENIPSALNALFQNSEMSVSDAIHIRGPEIAENGAVVPVDVETTLSLVEAVTILVEKNPFPLAANFSGPQQHVSTRLKLRSSTDVLVVVKAGGKLYFAKKPIKVSIGGCGGGSDTATPGMAKADISADFTSKAAVQKLTNTIKAKSILKEQHASVKVLISHPMETGLMKNKAGLRIPAHFIKRIVAKHNGQEVLAADWGIAISQNPYLAFDLPGAKKGDSLVIEWIDNENMTDQANISI